MKEKIIFNAKVQKIDSKIEEAIKKAGIIYPHPSCAFLRSIYAELGKGRVNKNGVVLAKTVEQDVSQLVGSQVNFSHKRYGNICGQIILAEVNENNEIEVVFTFHRNVYPEEFEEAMEALDNGLLSVSFELQVSKENITVTEEGYKEISRCEFDGCGLLMGEDEKPACPAAKILAFAKQKILDLIGEEENGLVFAKEAVINCKDLLESINKAIEAKKSYTCECLKCGKVIKSSNHCKDEKCPDCGGEMRRKDRPGSGDKASLDKNLKTENFSKEEIKVNKKSQDALLAKFKEGITKELGEDIVKDWTEEQWVAELEKRAKVEGSKERVDAKKSVIVTEEKMITTETYDDESGEYKTNRAGTRVVTQDGKVSVDEKFDNSVIYTFAQVEEIKADYEKQLKEKDEVIVSRDKTISGKEKVIENAKQIIEIRQELGNFAKDLSDEDILDEAKVEEAKSKKENSEKVEKAKEDLKDNEFAKDFSDEDYLNVDKTENAKLKKEVADLKTKKEPIVANKKKDEKIELDASTKGEEEKVSEEAKMRYMKSRIK